jgi:uncharacterized membrane protein YgcG
MLLETLVPADGRPITPDDIAFVTFYTDQAVQTSKIAAEVDRMSKKIRGKALGLRNIAVISVAQARGREWPIVIYMGVVSSPDKLWPEASEVLPIRFTFESGNLCVSLSRAKYHLALFGDFRCLMQYYASQHNGALQIKIINKLLRDLWDEGAIISVGDWNSNAPPQNGSFGSLIRTLAEVDLRDPESAASGNFWDADARHSLPYGYARASDANRGGGCDGGSRRGGRGGGAGSGGGGGRGGEDGGRGGGAWCRGNEVWRRGSWRDRGGNTAD